MRKLFSLVLSTGVRNFKSMMKYQLLPLLLLVFVTGLDAQDEAVDAKKPLWKPTVGEFWTYDVSVEVPKNARLPEKIAGQKIEEVDGKMRASYQQTAVYHGLLPLSDDGPKAHAFYFSNGDQLEEIQYMAIEDNSIQAVASKQEGEKPGKVVSLSAPIPVIDADWKGGESFPVIMNQKLGDENLRMTRQFRAIGWEQVETGAGSYNAMHVQVVGMNGALEIKRGYWFAPGTGFIKEVKKYYLGDTMIMKQTRELKKTGKPKPAE